MLQERHLDGHYLCALYTYTKYTYATAMEGSVANAGAAGSMAAAGGAPDGTNGTSLKVGDQVNAGYSDA